MKRVQLTGLGKPEEVCTVARVEAAGAPAANEVVVAIKAAAINPADRQIMEGRYPGPTAFPANLGIEGAGEVVAVGDEVSNLMVGDRVMSLGRENWVERVRGDAAMFVKLPPAIAWEDAAQLKANPPSAHLMINNYVDLEAGDWIVQNAANSAVGRHVIRLARTRGLKTVNVVRRDSLIPELEAIGADLVLVDGDDLGKRVRDVLGADAKVRLAIDAVAGAATMRLADTLSNGGTVVNYGFLDGNPCLLSPHQAVFQGISLTGFWLAGYLPHAERSEVEALYAKMAQHFIDGELDVPVEAQYALDDVQKAVAHANAEARSGKILLRT
ncbi:MAG: zinc-dependent alcohol dehydrogenase family protein [Pseudomonadota bacterium]